jgi:hypothetical protein
MENDGTMLTASTQCQSRTVTTVGRTEAVWPSYTLQYSFLITAVTSDLTLAKSLVTWPRSS